jgi:hypothetical protein
VYTDDDKFKADKIYLEKIWTIKEFINENGENSKLAVQ